MEMEQTLEKINKQINGKMLNVINSPVMLQNLCTMRDKNTKAQEMRITVRKITRILMYEASKCLPLSEKTVETPLVSFRTKSIDSDIDIIISPILRAGLIFTDEAIDILPQACIRHIGMYRDEKTLKPVWYYNKVPLKVKNPNKCYVFITDPMLATGNSLIEAIKLYAQMHIPFKNIKVISIISAPEGVFNIQSKFPEVEIFTASLDSHLNEHGYIVPGMGDAGDRIFNT